MLLGTQRVDLTRKISIKILKVFTMLVAISIMEIQLKQAENTLKHRMISVGLYKALPLKAFQEGFPATSLP